MHVSDDFIEVAPVETRPGAKRFLTEFLTTNPTSDRIDEMWGRAGADVFLPRPPREFLEQHATGFRLFGAGSCVVFELFFISIDIMSNWMRQRG